jgi:hypothetical protein
VDRKPDISPPVAPIDDTHVTPDSSVFNRFPYYRVYLQLFGLACGFLGLLSSAFATKPWHLIVTLGMVYPFVCCKFSPFSFSPFFVPPSSSSVFRLASVINGWLTLRRFVNQSSISLVRCSSSSGNLDFWS